MALQSRNPQRRCPLRQRHTLLFFCAFHHGSNVSFLRYNMMNGHGWDGCIRLGMDELSTIFMSNTVFSTIEWCACGKLSWSAHCSPIISNHSHSPRPGCARSTRQKLPTLSNGMPRPITSRLATTMLHLARH